MSSTLFRSIVKIRKQQKCFSCYRKFPVGTEMERGTFVEDGIYTLHTCKTCLEFFTLTRIAIRDNDGRIEEGWMREYMNNNQFKGTPEEYLEFYKKNEKTYI